MAQRFNVPVGFIACGIGATSVREWLPKGTRFPNPPTLVGRVQQLPSGAWESKGEAFAKVAKAASEDERSKSRGGDMGWQREGSSLLDPTLDAKITAAKDAPLGESKILVKGTPDKGEAAETEFKVTVSAK